jgi:hypothetical protein
MVFFPCYRLAVWGLVAARLAGRGRLAIRMSMEGQALAISRGIKNFPLAAKRKVTLNINGEKIKNQGSYHRFSGHSENIILFGPISGPTGTMN